jgi:hypothetical protein
MSVFVYVFYLFVLFFSFSEEQAAREGVGGGGEISDQQAEHDEWPTHDHHPWTTGQHFNQGELTHRGMTLKPVTMKPVNNNPVK